MKKTMFHSCLMFLILLSASFNPYDNGKVSAINRTGWSWSETEIVSFESDLPSHFPDVAIDSSNNLHVVWDDITDGYMIYYAKWDVSTETWSSMELVSPDSTVVAERPAIAIDKDDNIHVVWNDDTNYFGTAGTDHDVCYSMKAASSNSWTGVEIISTESTSFSGYAQIDCDGEGNLHVVWYDGTDYLSCGLDTDIFYKKWYASSSSWGVAEVVSTESDDFSNRAQICVTADEYIFVAWQDDSTFDLSGPDKDIFFKRKKPSGDWLTTEVLSWLSDSQSEYVDIECEDNGRIHAVWNDYSNILESGSDIDAFYCMYAPNLDAWTNIEVVSDMCVLSSSQPAVTVDKFGDVHVVWHDSTPHGGSGSDYDVMYRILDGTSRTWFQELVVSTENDDNSYYSVVRTDTAGTVHIIWQDAMDFLGSGTDYDVFYRKLSGPIDETTQPGIFQALDIGEIIILAAIFGGFQIILAVITYLLLRKRK